VKTCPHCNGPRKPYNATCTRSRCQEASYYACVARSARGARKRTLEAKAAAVLVLIALAGCGGPLITLTCADPNKVPVVTRVDGGLSYEGCVTPDGGAE
jgi:hypothetical protein